MKLYHGTSERFLPRIRREGLKPRGRKKGNWKAHPSRPDCVYLTNSYAVFYANACAKGREKLVVLEIDTDKLNTFAFAPDEDFLEQANRGRDNISGGMTVRSKWYRDNLHNWAGFPLEDEHTKDGPATMSLKFLGNCTYFGCIPPSAFTRIAVINMNPVPQFVLNSFDPSIVLMNYAICGPKYRNSLKWLFGYELEPDPLEDMKAAALAEGAESLGLVAAPEVTRDGILIEDVAQ